MVVRGGVLKLAVVAVEAGFFVLGDLQRNH
jgi:hypothetical protein